MEVTNQRIRVMFEDRGILSKTQKKERLNRSWVLLKPQLETISDVVSYIIQSFDLYDSCPNGIVLYMDGFVLPPFESAAILKDNDLICVKRKGTNLRDVTKAIEGAEGFIEDEIVEKLPLPSGTKLLANEEFDKETGGYQSETDDEEDEAEENPVVDIPSTNLASRKRKASSKIESSNSKAKRQRKITPESGQKKHARRGERTTEKKRKHENGSKGDLVSKTEVRVKCTKHLEPTSKTDEPHETRENTTSVSQVPAGAKKVSRSTRRKSVQRRWRKELRAKARMDEQCTKQLPMEDLNVNSGSNKDASTNIINHQQAEEESEADGDLVPVVIRPGHIRFTPSEKVKDVQPNQETNGWDVQQNQETNGWDVQQDQETNGWDVPSNGKAVWEGHSAKRNVWNEKKYQESFQWNGITNKRKGQKWGMERQPSSSWKESRDNNVSPSRPRQNYNSSHRGSLQETNEWDGMTNKRKGQNWGKEKQPTPSWKSRDYNAQSSSTWASRKQLPRDTAVDFEKLVPLIDLPKAGDIVAYRLLELSSSWCPELSSFRVGKISWFEGKSNRIMLVPDPEYPLNLEKKTEEDDDDDSGQPPESSLYNEDGSLEIDFGSLVDVRIVKLGDLSQPEVSETPAANGTSVPSGTGTPTANGTPVPVASKEVGETQDGSKNVAPNVGNGEVHTPAPENGKKDVWDEISEALTAKKAQLMEGDSWTKKENSAKRSWSQRTLRSSALGPTMALLRAQNGI